MLDIDSQQTAVVRALRERLAALDRERATLAARVHDLEAEVQNAREAAERCASEAIHLDALIAFYEDGSRGPRTQVERAPVASEPETVTRPSERGDAADPTLPPRRAAAKWTLAWRDEALAVLRASGGPMHYRELYRAISARGFTFGGKSPEATFLASLSREQTTFVGVGRGCYWIGGEPVTPDAVVTGPKRRIRKPKPIGGGR